MADRATAASVTRRYGAWLVSWDCHHEVADVSTPADLYDAASSLSAAKRIAVAGARGFGFTGAVRWNEVGPDDWRLTMTYSDADEDEDLW